MFLYSERYIEGSESCIKLFEFYETTVIGIKFLEEVNGKFFIVLIGLSKFSKSAKNVVNIGFPEDFRTFSEISVCELIATEKLESELVQGNGVSEHEISFVVVVGGNGVLVLGTLKEFTGPDTRVTVSMLVDLYGIVTTEERDNEGSGVVLLILTDESSFVSEDVLIASKHLVEVLSGRLGL